MKSVELDWTDFSDAGSGVERNDWNDQCPLDRTINRVFFALMVSFNHLTSIYATVLSIAFLIKMAALKNSGSGIIQRWSCSCAVAGMLPILVQNCVQIVQTSKLNTETPTVPKYFAGAQILTISTQFLRNWIYTSAAGVEYYLSTSNVTLKILHLLNLTFYAQIAFISLFTIPFYYILSKLHLYRTLKCNNEYEDLPILAIVKSKSASLAAIMVFPLIVHVLPMLILVVLKMQTAKHVLTLSASDRGLETRWSFIARQVYISVTMCGLAVGVSVKEIGLGVWKGHEGSWDSTAAVAVVDAIMVIMVMGAANGELALQNASGGRGWPVYLRASLCECCLRFKKMSVFRPDRK